MDQELLKDLTKDIWKYILVGGLGFAISSVYQVWTLRPENNLTILPLTVSLDKSSDGKTFCRIDEEAAIKLLRATPQDDPIFPYISGLLGKPKLLIDMTTQDAIELKSKSPAVFKCDNANLRPLPKTTIFAALIMNKPAPYLLEKNCTILFLDDGATALIPATISVAGKQSPFVFSNTDVLSIIYNPIDPSATGAADMKSIEALENQLEKGGQRDTKLGLRCQIAQKRAWYELMKDNNYSDIKSGLEKIRINQGL